MATALDVPIYCRQMVTILADQIPVKPTHRMRGNGSGFLIAFRDSTWLITAGHFAHDLKELYERNKLVRLMLCDAWSGTDGHGQAVPFPHDWMRDWVIVGQDGDYDVAMLKLPGNTVSLLEKGHITVAAEDEWRNPPKVFDSYELVGSPGEIIDDNERQFLGPQGQDVRHLATTVEIKRGVFKLEKIPTPANIVHPSFERFYARALNVPEAIKLDDIGGVSGGPILGIINKPNGERAYHTIAVQSAWLKYGDKSLIANYLYLLPEMLNKRGIQIS